MSELTKKTQQESGIVKITAITGGITLIMVIIVLIFIRHNDNLPVVIARVVGGTVMLGIVLGYFESTKK